jgi:uncharacterized protein YkwD
MKKHTLTVLICIAILTLTGCGKAIHQNLIISETFSTVMPSVSELQTHGTLLTVSASPTETPTLAPPAASFTPQAIITPSATNTPKPTVTPSPTQRPVHTASPKPASTPKLTATPVHSGVTPMSSSYKNAVLRGVNYVRTHNGDYSSDPIGHLDSSLSAMAQKHAEEMAEKGDIFHSSWGPESVSCGNLGNGENAGVQSAVHAAGLLDPEITRIGVGAARSADGTIYLCVVGGK